MSLAREASREAIRSLTATPRRFALLLAVIAAATSVIAVREARFTDELRTDALARIQAGEFVYTANLLAEGRAGVPGDGCERLANLTGVVAAGVERNSTTLSFDSHPTGGYRSVVVTPGRLSVADQQHITHTESPLTPMLIGSAAATEMGLRGTATVAIEGSVGRATVLEATGARSGTLDRSLVRLDAPSLISGTCYVEFAAATSDEATTILPALLAADVSEGLDVRPLISLEALGPSPVSRYDDRPDRYLWAVLLAMTFLPVVMVTRTRRNELATYAMFGAAPAWISLVLIIESLLLASVAASVALSLVILLEPGATGAMVPAIQAGGRYLSWLLVFEVALAIVVPVLHTRLYELMRRAD